MKMKTLCIQYLACLALFHAAVLQAASFNVNTLDDEYDTPSGAAVSLREALRDAAATPEADIITFDPALSGGTISLGSEITVNDPDGVIIDATDLPGGLTIDDGAATTYGLFSVQGGTILEMRRLTLANGGGSNFTGAGAAINSYGSTLTLTACTLTGNESYGGGGAIYNNNSGGGTLSLTQCTLSQNQTGGPG